MIVPVNVCYDTTNQFVSPAEITLREKYYKYGLNPSCYTYEEWCAIYPFTKEQ